MSTNVVFQGNYFAIGYTVSVSVCGLDCGDYVVDQYGQVTVPINSDPDKNFNGAYISQFDVGPFDTTTYGDATTRIDLADGSGGVVTVFVPVVIGFTYPSWGAPLRPMAEDQTKTPMGGALGKTRRQHWASALLFNTQGINFGTSTSADFFPAALTSRGGTTLPKNALFSGVWADTVDGDYEYDGIIAWNTVRPYATTVVALNGFLETAER